MTETADNSPRLPVRDRFWTAVSERMMTVPSHLRPVVTLVFTVLVVAGCWRGRWWAMAALFFLFGFIAWTGWVMEQAREVLFEESDDE